MANEVAFESNFVVGGTLLVCIIDISLATEMSIKDNVDVGLTTANKNLPVHGNASIDGS